MSKVKKKLKSDFWLGNHEVGQSFPEGFDFSKNGSFEGGYNDDIVALASARRAIGNFVSILTNLDIPVIFCELEGAPGATDFEKVILSSSISKREDFDWGCGLALHESGHILLTDKNFFISLWKKIPTSLIKRAAGKNICKDHISIFTKFMMNYVEDRFIDTYVWDTAPGYRGYYRSLYNKFFYCKKVSVALKSLGWRVPTLASYEMRIVNLTNPHTDLNALPGLKEICEMLDVKNIRRLKTTKDRFNVAIEMVEKVLENVDKETQKKENKTVMVM